MSQPTRISSPVGLRVSSDGGNTAAATAAVAGMAATLSLPVEDCELLLSASLVFCDVSSCLQGAVVEEAVTTPPPPQVATCALENCRRASWRLEGGGMCQEAGSNVRTHQPRSLNRPRPSPPAPQTRQWPVPTRQGCSTDWRNALAT